MKKKSKGIGIACIFAIVIMTASGCKAAAVDTENSVPVETSAHAYVMEPTKEPTATDAVTTAKATQKVTATPAPTVKETTAATISKPSETKAPAVTTKATAAPAASTKAPATTTKAPAATTAAPPVETAAPPAATTAAPAKDYSAMCAEIRSKLIAILEANGKWDPNFTGTVTGWGQKWWGVGWYDDGDMTTQDFADEYYNGKFSMSVGVEVACGIDCYVTDGKIYLDYRSFTPA